MESLMFWWNTEACMLKWILQTSQQLSCIDYEQFRLNQNLYNCEDSGQFVADMPLKLTKISPYVILYKQKLHMNVKLIEKKQHTWISAVSRCSVFLT